MACWAGLLFQKCRRVLTGRFALLRCGNALLLVNGETYKRTNEPLPSETGNLYGPCFKGLLIYGIKHTPYWSNDL